MADERVIDISNLEEYKFTKSYNDIFPCKRQYMKFDENNILHLGNGKTIDTKVRNKHHNICYNDNELAVGAVGVDVTGTLVIDSIIDISDCQLVDKSKFGTIITTFGKIKIETNENKETKIIAYNTNGIQISNIVVSTPDNGDIIMSIIITEDAIIFQCDTRIPPRPDLNSYFICIYDGYSLRLENGVESDVYLIVSRFDNQSYIYSHDYINGNINLYNIDKHGIHVTSRWRIPGFDYHIEIINVRDNIALLKYGENIMLLDIVTGKTKLLHSHIPRSDSYYIYNKDFTIVAIYTVSYENFSIKICYLLSEAEMYNCGMLNHSLYTLQQLTVLNLMNMLGEMSDNDRRKYMIEKRIPIDMIESYEDLYYGLNRLHI